MAVIEIEYEAKHPCGYLTADRVIVNEEAEECEIGDVIEELKPDSEQISAWKLSRTGKKLYYKRYAE
jgi:predicted naringenin-chalcone synthase